VLQHIQLCHCVARRVVRALHRHPPNTCGVQPITAACTHIAAPIHRADQVTELVQLSALVHDQVKCADLAFSRIPKHVPVCVVSQVSE
jgi:hypothetical protein